VRFAGLALCDRRVGTAKVYGARVPIVVESGRVVDWWKHCLHRVRSDRALVFQCSDVSCRAVNGWAKSDSANIPELISVLAIVQKEFEVVHAEAPAIDADNITGIIANEICNFEAYFAED